MDADMLRKMREAYSGDEAPLVKALQEYGLEAWTNDDVTTQRSKGDVFCRTAADRPVLSFESQVSHTHTNFSWAKSKIDKYVGPDGNTNHAFFMIGCRQSSKDDKMLYAIGFASDLKAFVQDLENHARDMGDYFIVSPGSFRKYDGCLYLGDTIVEAVKEFVEIHLQWKRDA